MTRSPTGWFDFGGNDPMIDVARELAPRWLGGLVPKEDTEGFGGLCVLVREITTNATQALPKRNSSPKQTRHPKPKRRPPSPGWPRS